MLIYLTLTKQKKIQKEHVLQNRAIFEVHVSKSIDWCVSIVSLEITNLTETRRVSEPEEVQCDPPPHLAEMGCKWVKRRLGEEGKETLATKGRLLNLYRPEFDSGTYVCIVECNIRGHPCPVEALTITYEPAGTNYRGKTR